MSKYFKCLKMHNCTICCMQPKYHLNKKENARKDIKNHCSVYFSKKIRNYVTTNIPLKITLLTKERFNSLDKYYAGNGKDMRIRSCTLRQ